MQALSEMMHDRYGCEWVVDSTLIVSRQSRAVDAEPQTVHGPETLHFGQNAGDPTVNLTPFGKFRSRTPLRATILNAFAPAHSSAADSGSSTHEPADRNTLIAEQTKRPGAFAPGLRSEAAQIRS